MPSTFWLPYLFFLRPVGFHLNVLNAYRFLLSVTWSVSSSCPWQLWQTIASGSFITRHCSTTCQESTRPLWEPLSIISTGKEPLLHFLHHLSASPPCPNTWNNYCPYSRQDSNLRLLLEDHVIYSSAMQMDSYRKMYHLCTNDQAAGTDCKRSCWILWRRNSKRKIGLN